MLFLNRIFSLFILRNKWAATFLITATLLLSIAVIGGLHTNLKSVEENRIKEELSRVKNFIIDRIDTRINSLHAVRGLFVIEGKPSPDKFKVFVAQILERHQNPITNLIGYASYVPQQRQLIKTLETNPASTTNALKLNNPAHRDAILKSIETGQATLSVPPDNFEVQHPDPFVIYLPVFGEGIPLPKTVSARRQNVKGFLYSSLRINHLFQSIFDSSEFWNKKINFSLLASQNGRPLLPMFSRFPNQNIASSAKSSEERFTIMNQEWILRLTPTEKLLTPAEKLLIVIAWIAVILLITIVLYAIKKTQLFMIQEEKCKKLLLEASLAKSNFLANMSHEIRTPMGAIVGFSDLISKESLTPERKKHFLLNIEKNVQILTRIIDDVLDHSRIEAGKLPIEKTVFSLSKLLQDIESMMSLEAEKKQNLVFKIISRNLIPEQLISDEIRLKQILMNLIGNALKFTRRGHVTLTVQCPAHDVNKKPCLEFLIEDTGIGIPYEVQKQLFDGFVQADASTTRRYGGTGLGLALSKQLAKLLGGDAELLRSSPGDGSLFRVQIPVENVPKQKWLEHWRVNNQSTESDPIPSKKQVSTASELLNKSILLVEDSEDNQEIFKIFLESVGAKVDIVSNGIDAVYQISCKHYDLILMDIQIPGIDGKEATRQIRSSGYLWPIVALTAHAMPHEIESCIQSGCNGQITKPVSGEQLIRETESFL